MTGRRSPSGESPRGGSADGWVAVARGARGIAVALACVGALASCSTVEPGTATPTPSSSGLGTLRTDTAPLTDRFPSLGDPVSATWVAETIGDDRAPGPATYRIDAVITVSPSVAATLAATMGESTAETPSVITALESSIPAGETQTSQQLDESLSTSNWVVNAWLVDGTDTVVLSALGSGD